MIEGIDIFAPRDNGLVDLSKITPVQIFNGSALASFQTMRERVAPQDKPAAPRPLRALDPITGRPVPYGEQPHEQSVVESLLNGGSARNRGHSRVQFRPSGGGSGGYTVPGQIPELPLPGSEEPARDDSGNILLPGPNAPSPPQGLDWHPPMLPIDQPRSEDGLFPNPELAPKVAALRGMPTILLDELKNLHLI